jgi:ankyrin repeat protein
MELIEPLIQRGALETNGAPDQSKIDAAFQAAVMGGRLGPVERIWSIAGARPHPSLTFEDVSDDQQRTRKTAPVAVLLRRPERFDGPWEGFEITQWLMARGCDIKGAGADKDTLLHIAASAGDVEWVRYLLNQGFDPSIPGRHDLTALDGTRSEDVALLLLEAGADVSKLDDSGQHFRGFAHANHWARVIAWLDAH